MNKNSPFYQAMAMTVNDIANSYRDEDIIEHRFSWRYKRKEKAILKAYLKSKEQKTDFNRTFAKVSLANKIRFAIIMILAAILLTGCLTAVVYYIGGFQLYQYDTHTSAFALDDGTAPKEINKRYRITCDMSGYNYELKCDYSNIYWEVYKNDTGKISYIFSTKEAFENARLNTENSKIEEITINGNKAIYYVTQGGVECAVWVYDDYVFELNFTIPYDDAIIIAESIAIT